MWLIVDSLDTHFFLAISSLLLKPSTVLLTICYTIATSDKAESKRNDAKISLANPIGVAGGGFPEGLSSPQLECYK